MLCLHQQRPRGQGAGGKVHVTDDHRLGGLTRQELTPTFWRPERKAEVSQGPAPSETFGGTLPASPSSVLLFTILGLKTENFETFVNVI